MRILLINPNTSPEMTERAAAAASRCASTGTEIVAATGEFGCAVIASRASYAIAAHTALDLLAKHNGHADGVVLTCFGDPGLAAMREVAAIPVVGLAEAAVEEAARAAQPFAIVTAGAAWVPMLTEFVAATPHASLFRGVFALPATGLAFARDQARFAGALEAALDRAEAAGAQTIVLGGAGFAGSAAMRRTRITIIEPLQAAVRAVERAVRGDSAPTPAAPIQACESRNLSPELAALLAGR